MRKLALLVTVAATAIAAPAMAQDGGQAAPQDTTADDTSPSGDIIVTAQGRDQLLSDVPVAVSAVSAETLALSGATDIRALNQLAPSLLVSSTGSEANGSARIRGIGTVGDNPGLESSVAVFIDGVYRSRSGIGLNELGEIDRIEVLRGPQGTLGGRNSSAGLISIVSKKPSFDRIEGMAEATYGNYDFWRGQAALNVPLGETLAARVDGVYVKRDGFYRDARNNTDVNDRDRYFVRGQLRFEPSSDLSVRIIGDYSKRDEKCCGAIYIDRSINPYIGDLNSPATLPTPVGGTVGSGNNIVNVIRDLGQNIGALNAGYSRNLSVSAGRSYAGTTEDKGISGQVDFNFGGASLTSITAYRDYSADQGGDFDYSSVDILYRAADGNARRRFKTFTQELRLQGSAFDDKLDWLVGGFYADEKLRLTDNFRFGSQYGRFATCRAVSGATLAFAYSPTSQSCISTTPSAALGGASPRQALLLGLLPGINAQTGAVLAAAFDRLDTVNDKGSTLDRYNQNSRNYAIFTHNIFHVTDKLDVTLGVRYTNERKRLNVTFGNDNTACPAQQAALAPFLTTPLAATAGALIGLTCQGNSTSELNGVNISDVRKEDKFTGTAILSYKPTDDLLVYASFSRGYKAGGFNLDRSALKSPVLPFGGQAGAQALVRNLQFDPETVNAYEVGAKYSTGPFGLSVAAFRQEFKNFQLNTFDGTVFIVQNVNGCKTGLGGADEDQSKFATAPNFNAAAATTGACATSDVTYGVRSQGVELEASLVPMRDVRVGLGFTYTDTSYRDDIIGNATGAPLNQALRKLPGRQLSNAPEIVSTASLAFTPDLGGSGLSGLFYVDTRLTGDYNTGSDLFPQKAQDGYALVNARVGIRGPDEKWAIEFWGQNVFNKNYAQVAFNSPFQEGAASGAFADPQYPGGRQIFSQYLAEPRTYGVTGRVRF